MRSRVVPGRSSTIATRSPTRRLKSVDLPTFGRPTMATTARDISGAPLTRERFGPLLHFEQRLHRCRTAADETDALDAGEPPGFELGGMLDVIRGLALHAREMDDLSGIGGVLPADDDDPIGLARELGRGGLPFDRYRAD